MSNNSKKIKLGILDSLNENKFTICDCLVKKYEGRVLLELTYKCAVKCEFCSRSWKLDSIKSDISDENINLAMEYILNNKDIKEVIISGGDPLVVPQRLRRVMKNLEKMQHVRIIRIHTRLPIIKPKLFDKKLLSYFRKYKKIIYLSFHVEKFSELNKENKKIISKLRKSGVGLYSQSVFLKGINDNVLELKNMFNGLLEIGVRPYLIYHCDHVKGAEKFFVDIEKERRIMSQLRKQISGLACPVHVIDANLGCGKIPVPDNSWECNIKSFKDFKGKEIKVV